MFVVMIYCHYCRPSHVYVYVFFVFFQAEDGIRDLVRSRGLGDVYKRQQLTCSRIRMAITSTHQGPIAIWAAQRPWLVAGIAVSYTHLTLPTSDLV